MNKQPLVEEPRHKKLKTTIGRVPRLSRRKRIRKTKKKDISEEEQVPEGLDLEDHPLPVTPKELESEDDVNYPPAVTPATDHPAASSSNAPPNPEESLAKLKMEALALLKPNSYTASGFRDVDASVILAAILALEDEESGSLLDMGHEKLVAGFRRMAQKRLRKRSGGKHTDSPEHKRPRRK